MYRYGFINRQTGEVIDVCYGIEATIQAIDKCERTDDVLIRPIMLRTEYLSQSADYRGEKNGEPWILYLDINGSTTYGPVVILDQWGKWNDL
ncbi:hypothetical protein WJ0W_006683 [Paenibacillus melissococcoides]|uniref:Uncharacterized protein n=1 Tax=Paenibacillus melissococcoides TaxID=2912268 RepID=A0ABM9GBY6_9BACL|nr:MULTISPECIES: hypothetical protein [Paenibacillus]MEB9895706.1 hypothetical protein [Bacillus cereus]GIO81546.1 hypothetical protein J6TS7_51560 [Paenibacillus dendritiformis]CAH8249498.1 hypothetical protein WJ0W_006683 [Paenibacillus melissococcoides]CAH8721191.1 hypothetical protein HTL2_006235 [Paenibacillus melissococcoides]